MSVTFNFNVPEIMGNIDAANQYALVVMGEQVLMDSNYFCKFDQGILIASSLVGTTVSFADCNLQMPTDMPPLPPCEGSDLESGVITWDTPYAARQYYLENANAYKDKNPNAQNKWFHAAQDIYSRQWNAVYKKAFEKAMKGGG